MSDDRGEASAMCEECNAALVMEDNHTDESMVSCPKCGKEFGQWRDVKASMMDLAKKSLQNDLLKGFLITHEPQPISAGGRAWAVFGRWPRSGGGSWLRDRSA